MKSTLIPPTPHFWNRSIAGCICSSSVLHVVQSTMPTFLLAPYCTSAGTSMFGDCVSRSPSLYHPSSRMMYGIPFFDAKSMKYLYVSLLTPARKLTPRRFRLFHQSQLTLPGLIHATSVSRDGAAS